MVTVYTANDECTSLLPVRVMNMHERWLTYVQSVEHGNALEQRFVHFAFVECILQNDATKCWPVLRKHIIASIIKTEMHVSDARAEKFITVGEYSNIPPDIIYVISEAELVNHRVSHGAGNLSLTDVATCDKRLNLQKKDVKLKHKTEEHGEILCSTKRSRIRKNCTATIISQVVRPCSALDRQNHGRTTASKVAEWQHKAGKWLCVRVTVKTWKK